MIDRLVLVLLLAGCALAAAIITVEMARTPDRDDPVSIASSAPEPALPSARPEPPGRYNELSATILARPLFSSTRRPRHAAGTMRRLIPGSPIRG